jgi:hypothetical protein
MQLDLHCAIVQRLRVVLLRTSELQQPNDGQNQSKGLEQLRMQKQAKLG